MVKKNKPSSIHSKRLTGMTRRRMFKALVAAGFSSAAASRITVNDVKAAESNQVPVALDTEGNSIVMVDSDWYDWLASAKKARSKVRSKWLDHRDVVGIWLTSGGSGQGNPHIDVELDGHSGSKEETRGKIPEYKDGIKVNVSEVGERRSLSQKCATPDCYDDKDFYPELPGGVAVEAYPAGENEGCGTLAPWVVDLEGTHEYSGCWITAAHMFCNRDTNNAYHYGQKIGDVVTGRSSPYDYDFVAIEPVSGVYALDEIRDANNASKNYEIGGTITKDGVHTSENKGYTVHKHGIGNCHQDGNIKGDGDLQTQSADICGDPDSTFHGQIRWGDEFDATDGDSGSAAFINDPNDENNYFVLSLCNFSSGLLAPEHGKSYIAGTAGHVIENKFGFRFTDDGRS